MAGEIIDGGGATTAFTATLDGGASTTVYPPVAPTVLPLPDGTPVPSVQITVAEVWAGTQTVTVYRLADGRTTPVRGGIRKFAVGGAAVVDWEAPFGVPITYRVEFFADTDGLESLGYSEPAVTQLDVDRTWIHQPLNPTLSVSPKRLWGTAETIDRSTPGDLVYAQRSSRATWVGGTRRGIADMPYELLTETLAEADRMQAIFGTEQNPQPPVVCIRTPPPMRGPRTFYAAVAQVTETPIDTHVGGEAVQFSFTATEARPPAPGLIAALLRRDDIDAVYPTRAARAAAYLTRLDRDSDYSLAGAADA